MHFGLDIKSSMKRQEIKAKFANKLIVEKFFETRDFDIFKFRIRNL